MKDAELLASKNHDKQIQTLQAELAEALEFIEAYKQSIRAFTHNLANPLQIITMSLESLLDNSKQENHAMLLRMKKSADKMSESVTNMRLTQLNDKQLKNVV